MNTDRKTNIKLISVIRRKAKNDHMSLSELTEKLKYGIEKKNRQRLVGDMGRGTIREEGGNPVTEVTFKPQGRSPGLKLPYPIDQSTCPHNK